MTLRVPRRAILGGCVALLAGCAAPRQGVLRPAGGKADGRILFAVNDSTDPKKNSGIWVLTNGGNAKRIIAQDTSAYALGWPRWIRSPISAGQMEDRIAFVKVGDRGIYSDLYTARQDGTDQRQMTSFRSKIQYGTDIDAERNYVQDSSIVAGLSWSRDGGFLTFACDSRSGTMRPWVAEDVTARVGDPKIHFITATATLGQPVDSTAASPDGKFMVFSMLWQAANDPSKVSQIYLLNLGTKQWRALTDTTFPFGAYDPTFSPDNQWVAFVGRPDFRVNDIYIMSRDGGVAPQKVTDTGVARGPVFSPDGRKLAFLANIDSGQFSIYTVDISPPPDANSPFTIGKPEKVLDGIDWVDARSGLSWAV